MSHAHQLRERARTLFPSSPTLQSKWVRARLRLVNRKPRVQISVAAIDTSRAPRTLKEAGIYGHVESVFDLPPLLKKFVGLH